MPEKISVLLVDDHSLVRRGFRRILEDEPDITVAGEASSGEEAVKLARELEQSAVTFATAWTLSRDFVASTIIGATTVAQLDDLAADAVNPQVGVAGPSRLGGRQRGFGQLMARQVQKGCIDLPLWCHGSTVTTADYKPWQRPL